MHLASRAAMQIRQLVRTYSGGGVGGGGKSPSVCSELPFNARGSYTPDGVRVPARIIHAAMRAKKLRRIRQRYSRRGDARVTRISIHRAKFGRAAPRNFPPVRYFRLSYTPPICFRSGLSTRSSPPPPRPPPSLSLGGEFRCSKKLTAVSPGPEEFQTGTEFLELFKVVRGSLQWRSGGTGSGSPSRRGVGILKGLRSLR